MKAGWRVQVDEDGRPVSTNLLRVPEFRALLPDSSNVFHPHEMSAGTFSTLVIQDHFTPRGRATPLRPQRMAKRLAPVRQWFRAHLGQQRKGSSGADQVRP